MFVWGVRCLCLVFVYFLVALVGQGGEEGKES